MMNVYDFDGTIYNGDSSVDFYLFCLKKKPSIIFLLPIQLFGILLYKLKLKNKEYMKSKFFCFLRKLKNIDELVKEFWNKNSKKIQKWYLDQKSKTDVIISASPEFLLKPLEKELKIDAVIASKVNKKTGAFESKNCYGEEKVCRFKNEYKNQKIENFYTDSIKADAPIMKLAQNNYLIDSNKPNKINNVEQKSKKDNLIIKLGLVLFLIIFGYIFVNVIFNNNNTIPKVESQNLLLYVFLYGTFIVVLFKIMSYKKINVVVKVLFIILLIALQLVFAHYFSVHPSWDFGAVHDGAISHIEGSAKFYENDYFYRYSNNLGLALFLSNIYNIFKIIGYTHYLKIGIALNIVMIDTCIIYIYRLSRLFFDKKKSDCFLILSLIFTPFIAYVPIFYTDTISMPFTIASLYYYFKSLKTDSKVRKIVSLALCGLLLGFGGVIKITVVILYVALVFYSLLQFKLKDCKKTICRFALITIMMAAPLLMLSHYQKSNFDSKKMNSYNFPYTHWIMMGMHDLGTYYHTDVEYTISFNTYNEKAKANIKEIKKRFKEKLNNNTLISSYTDKIVFVFGDGTFFAPEKLQRQEVKIFDNKKYVLHYPDNKLYLNLAQTEWIVCFFFILAGVLLRKHLNKSQKNLQLVVLITIFGTLMFFVLWEARSRYLVNMIPILLVGGFLGIEATYNLILKKNKDLEENYEK